MLQIILDLPNTFWLSNYSVEISGFFCHSDFVWNQFWESKSPKKQPFWRVYKNYEPENLRTKYEPNRNQKNDKIRTNEIRFFPIWWNTNQGHFFVKTTPFSRVRSIMYDWFSWNACNLMIKSWYLSSSNFCEIDYKSIIWMWSLLRNILQLYWLIKFA